MSTMTDPCIISTKLEGQSTYVSWQTDVSGAAYNIDSGNEHGLIHQVVPPQAYLLFPNVLGPYVIQQPPRPAAGAGGGTIQIYKEELALWTQYQRTSKKLKTAIINSLSDVLLRDVTDHVTKAVIMTTPDLMEHFHDLFGVPNAAAIADMRAALLQPLAGTDITTFLAHSSRFRHIIGQFTTALQPLAMYDQMTYFRDTCAGQPAVTASIERYIEDNHDLQQRNLDDMILHIRRTLQNLVVFNAGYVQHANGLVNAANMQQVLQHGHGMQNLIDEMRRQGLVAVAQPRHAGAAPPHARVARNGQAPAQRANHGGAAPIRQPRNMAHYCWHHGYGHLGRDCLVMVNNPQQFNQAQINARNPGEVPGGHV